MKYIANKKFGVGEVTNLTDKKATIYFEDIDETKTLLISCIKFYSTWEDAENAIIEAEEKEAILEAKEESELDEITINGTQASADLAERNYNAGRKIYFS